MIRLGNEIPGKRLCIIFNKTDVIIKQFRSILLLSSFFFLSFHAFAQHKNYFFKHITVNDGLLSYRITTMYQDNSGFLWIGSQTGLQRYDGSRFKNYNADIRDTAALQSDWITRVFEDSKKRLWIGTENGGAYTLNRNSGKFHNYNTHASFKNRIEGVWHFAEDNKGNIWVAGHNGYFKLDESSESFISMNETLGIGQSELNGGLIIDNDNNLWLSTIKGIKLYNNAQKKLYDRQYNPQRNPLLDIRADGPALLCTKKFLWVTSGLDGIIYRYSFATGGVRKFSISDLVPRSLHNSKISVYVGMPYDAGNEKIIVFIPEAGAAVYDPLSETFNIIRPDNTKEYAYHSAGDNFFAYYGRDNNIFIGNGAGINIYNPDKQKFYPQSFEKEDPLYLQKPVSDFAETDNGDVLISYYWPGGGIIRTDSTLKFKQHYLTDEAGDGLSNQINTLFKDNRGIIWAPNQSGRIVKLNTATGKISEEKDTLMKGFITTVKQDNEGNIWEGRWDKGLVKIDAVTKKEYSYKDFKTTNPVTKPRVLCILQDRNKIWAGTSQNGLQLFDKRTGKFSESYEVNEKNPHAISCNTVVDILRYNNDTLILATLMGINVFDIKRKKFKTITVNDGLINNLTTGIMKDRNSCIWVVCEGSGICKINMHGFAINKYDINDGITESDISGKIFQLRNGSGLIASSKNIFSFNPADFKSSASPGDVLITGFNVYEKEVFIDSLQKNYTPLKLLYNENSIRIEFASLDYWSAAHIKYFYRLNGADKTWVLAGKNQAAVYNQLNDGEYLFEIKCANRDGIFCNGITRLKIIISPPYWKTWWFILLLIFTGFIIIRKLVKWREKNIRLIEEEKIKVQELNAAELKNKLELEQIINYFSFSLIDKNSVDDVLWDVAKNLIGRLGFVDCMIYLWNSDKTKMEQRAGYGPKGSMEDIKNNNFEVFPGLGVVGRVMQTKEMIVIADTSADNRYRTDDINRMSEISVPVICDDELIAVIDSEHHQKNFFTPQHARVLSTIAVLMANKISSIRSEQSLQKAKIEMLEINEKFSAAKLEALRSQMNPHFIFNSLNAIQECILTNKIDAAYGYLSEFSKLQRMVLNNSAKEFITLSSEIEMLRLYLSLESLRFSRSFTYSITIENNTDPDDITVPSMLIQPYVENAIWHGLRNKDGDQFLDVHFEEKAGELSITIDDNGVGRRKAEIIKSQKLSVGSTESKGTGLTEERIIILSMKYKSKLSVVIIDKENDKNEPFGTKVIIKLPTDIEADKI